MAEETITSIPIRDQAASIIRSRILRGEFAPGTALSERQLCDELGISTTPVKEAFRLLNAEGLLTTVPRKGTYVADISKSVEYMSYIRAALEGVAANFAAKYISPEQEDEIRSIVSGMHTCTKENDAEGLEDCNRRFHELLRKAAGSRYLENLLSQLSEIDRSARWKSTHRSPEEREQVTEEHEEVAEAILAHDGALADKLMNHHIREGYERLKSGKKD